MRIITACLICLGFLCSAPSFADSAYRSKLGIDIRGLKTNSQAGIGWLAGLRTARYLGSSNAYIGLSGYYGTPQGGNPAQENLWYTGLSIGYEGRISRIFIWETGLLVGIGSGKFPGTQQQSYYAVEPSGGIGFALGGGIKLTFAASYVHMTNASRFSGSTFGVRIDYKTGTSIKEINE